MFTKTAQFYDAIYSWKDYAQEVGRIQTFIQKYQQPKPEHPTLLDVACGTGKHLAFFKEDFDCTGVDLDANMLKVARERYPDISFHEGDMRDFQLDQSFDVITCLFSSIGYVKAVEKLQQTIQNFTGHLRKGGLVIVEPSFFAENIQPDTVHALFVNEPNLKIARMNITRVQGQIILWDFHYLIATLDGVEHVVEHHELAMFTHQEYTNAFQKAGLDVVFDAEGISGRGLYIGIQT